MAAVVVVDKNLHSLVVTCGSAFLPSLFNTVCVTHERHFYCAGYCINEVLHSLRAAVSPACICDGWRAICDWFRQHQCSGYI